MPQKMSHFVSKITLRELVIQLMLSQGLKDYHQMLGMILLFLQVNDDIIYKDTDKLVKEKLKT